MIKEKREAVAEHCRRLNVRRLDVFGSAANGSFDPAKSDIDFLVEMDELNTWYHSIAKVTLEDIVEHHWRFEKIHPFQDGNDRVGRLVMFRECLRNNIVPFIIDETQKQFYYRGLGKFETERVWLMETCLSAQDTYKEWMRYFQIA